MSVVVHRDENFFPRRIEIRKGTRKKPYLTVKQTPSPVGESYSIDFEGRRDVLPSIPEIVSIVNQKRLERIGTIEVVDEITLLKVLEELTLLKTIETIQTVTNPVKVKTEGLDNILIDLLKQGAYTERRSTLSNNEETVEAFIKSTEPRRLGKYFPRGARGFIRNVQIYCRDAGASGGTVTVYLAPVIGMGQVASKEITVPSGGAETWRVAKFDMMWNYDSLFIWVKTSTPDIQVGYDDTAEEENPYDSHRSDDAGANWYFCDYRLWYKAYIVGETCGDVPVSGTVNTIEIPSVGGRFTGGSKTVPSEVEYSMVSVEGSGTMLEARLDLATVLAPTSARSYRIFIYADGVLAGFTANWLLTQSETATSGRSATGIFVQCADMGFTFILFWMPIRFKRLLELKVWQNTGAGISGDGYLTMNKQT